MTKKRYAPSGDAVVGLGNLDLDSNLDSTTTTIMKYFYILAVALLPLALTAEVTTEHTITKKCSRKTQRGDKINVHYKGTLQDGTKFDSSYDRSMPLGFTVGQGQVIKGWDEGLLDMCPGDKRTLTIPPEFGYGSKAMGPIPADSTLIFETELMSIDGVAPEESSSSETESTEASTATESAASGTDATESSVDEPSEKEKEAKEQETKQDL